MVKINLMKGNCIELLKDVPSASVDMLLTDPPYKVISGGKNSRTGAFAVWKESMLKENDGRIFKHNDVCIDDWLPEVYRVLKEGAHFYIMVNFLNLSEFMVKIKATGLSLHNLLVWEKHHASPNRWYLKNCEYIIFGRKGSAKPINKMGSRTVHKFLGVTKNKLHPTEKPVELMEFYIKNSSNVGDVVLDPFFGSGATARASKNLERNFIGFEMDEAYFEIAKTRIESA